MNPEQKRLTALLGAVERLHPGEDSPEELDVRVERLYVAGGAPVPGADEMEMPDDDRQEPLPEAIDLSSILAEALTLNLPQYPRADDARLGEAVYAEPGVSPLRDEDTRPFAALAGLRRSDDPDA